MLIPHFVAPPSFRDLSLIKITTMDFDLFNVKPRVANQCDFDIDHDRYKWSPVGFRVRNRVGRVGIEDRHGLLGIYKTYANDTGTPSRHLPFYRPTNPNTPAQQVTRNTFKDGAAAWNALSPEMKQIFNERGARLNITGYNVYMQQYLYQNQ